MTSATLPALPHLPLSHLHMLPPAEAPAPGKRYWSAGRSLIRACCASLVGSSATSERRVSSRRETVCVKEASSLGSESDRVSREDSVPA